MSAALLSPRPSRVSWLAACGAVIWHSVAWCQPTTIERHSAIHDSARQRMVVFGGLVNNQPANDLWQLTLSGKPAWTPLGAAGTPPSRRFGHSAIYDPVRERMIVFGGQTDASALDDAWALSLADPASWTALQPSGSPPPARLHHSAIYDAAQDRMIVYGGSDSFGIPYGDVWCLWLAPNPRWEQIVATATPPPERLGHCAIYDPVRERMVIFSGAGFATNDAWALSLAGQPEWSLLEPSGNRPLQRVGHAAIYDPSRDRMVVIGGYVFTQYANDVWELSLTDPPAWSPLPVLGNPPSPRGYHSAVRDGDRDRAMLFGGTPNVADPTWALSLALPMRWSPARPAIQLSADELQLPTVTLGDTVSVPFVVSNVGLDPLQLSDFALPDPTLRVSSPAPIGLSWGEAVAETLFLAANALRPDRDSMVIVSNDPLVPRRLVGLHVHVLGLDFDTRILGDPAEAPLGAALVVVATPKPEVAIERCTLHYRIADGTSAFDSLAFTALATDFIAAIPGGAVTEHGVEYYVKVENSDFAATEPPTAPDQVLLQPVTAPTSMAVFPRPTSGQDFLTGRGIEVEVVLPAGASFVSGTIHYREGGKQVYATDVLTPAGALGRPVGIIPDSIVGAHGVEYWVEVATAKSTLLYGDPAAPAIVRTKVQDLAEPATHPGARYRLLSVPLDFADFAGGLDALLTDQLGTYDPVRWRAYAYDPIAEANVELSAAEAARFRPRPGAAFWLISRDAHRVDTRPIPGFSTPTGGEYPIALATGWNLFGNPFDFPVAWSDVRRDTATVGLPVAFDPSLSRIGDYADGSPPVLAAFEGYFVHASAPETLWVFPRAASAAGVHARASLPQSRSRGDEGSADSWRLHVRASTDEAVDGSNVLGVDTAALDGFDPADGPKPPPPPGPWVQAAFVHPDGQESSGRYRRDLRSPGSEGQTWEIEARSGTSGEPVTLELLGIPEDLALRLIDREQGTWLEASEGPALQHRIVSFGPRPYRLAVVAGTEGYVTRATEQTLAPPVRVTLDPVAPNPFRFATRIRFGLPRAELVTLEVFSVQGQRIATPLDRERREAGFHTVVWDGRLPDRRAAPSGVYLLRLVAGGEALTRRVVHIR